MELQRFNDSDFIYWVHTGKLGDEIFTFDKKIFFNFWRDYPQKLTKEQIEIFKKERPALARLKD